jgi:hypothetical protein
MDFFATDSLRPDNLCFGSRRRSGRPEAGSSVWAWRTALWLASIVYFVSLTLPAWSQTVQLVEFVYELDLSSLNGRPLPTFEADATADPDGFVIVSSASGGPLVLYQAMNTPLPQSPETGLWAALRFRDYLAGGAVDVKMLEAVAALPYSPTLQSSTSITPGFDIAIAEISDGTIVVDVDGISHTLILDEPAVIAVGERTVTLDAFADAVLETYAAAGVAQVNMPSREAVLEEVALYAFGGDEVSFHARVVAVNRGQVALAEVDLATTLEDARRLSREGPYEEALAKLETLLDVMPRHGEAGRLFHEMLDLVEAGTVPAHVAGTVSFPPGQPDDTIRALWEASFEGYALFARPDDPPGSAHIAIPIREGAFAAHLPAGTWRLTVSVPGLASSEVEITLDGESEIDVPLDISN